MSLKGILVRGVAAVSLLSAFSAGLVLSTGATARSPGAPVTLVVPYAAGGGTDTIARLIADKMQVALGRSVIVENVTGAGGTLANERVARSTPDGTSVLINHVGLLSAPSLFTNLRYDTKSAFEPVGLVNNAPMLLIGKKSIPGAAAQDHLAWIKEQGAKANYAHGGVGSNSHLCAIMMGNMLGYKPTFVAYRGSAPAIQDLLAGQIDLLWDQVTNALPQVQAGTLHGIAITSRQRLAELPSVPTTAELGISNLDYTMWHGLYVAKGTPPAEIASLNQALREAVTNPTVVARFQALGSQPFPSDQLTPAAHAKAFAADLPRISELVASAGVKAAEAK